MLDDKFKDEALQRLTALEVKMDHIREELQREIRNLRWIVTGVASIISAIIAAIIGALL